MLPVYEITLDENDFGIYATSLVEFPAIESEFIFMDKDKAPTFFVADEEQRIIVGAVLVPDKLIYRRDEYGNEYYVKFTKEVIRDIHTRMHETGFVGSFTVDHALQVRDGIQYLESWIKESENDKSVAFGLNEPIGTMFMEAKVENDLVWDLVKDGKLRGFSVELDASSVKLAKQKKEPMIDYEKLFTNAISIDEGKELRFNVLATENPVLLKETTEDGDVWSEYSGEFEHENFIYKAQDGKIAEILEKAVEAEEKEEDEDGLDEYTKAVQTALDNAVAKIEESFKSKLADIETKVNDVTAKLSETKLELKQMLIEEHKETEEFSEQNENKEFDVTVYKAVSAWGRK